jgi:AcrR family transcriptional regulator
MVIYSHIKSKERLLRELLKRALDVLYSYMIQDRTGDMWIDWGVGHVIFSIEEPELFKLILREHAPTSETGPQFRLWSTMLEAAKGYAPFDGLSDEQVEMLILRRYMFSVGLATHLSKAPEGLLSEAQIIEMIKGTSLALLEGARSGTMTVV